MLTVRQSPGKGRGVFAERAVAAGTVLERAHMLVVPGAEWERFGDTLLNRYCYSWGSALEDVAVGLGNASLYNHSYRPNAVYHKRFDEQIVEFVALRPIAAGEEVTINYNGTPDDATPVEFDMIDE